MQWDTNYIYVDGDLIFFSPDGNGRIFFSSVEEAKSETGLTKVIVSLTVQQVPINTRNHKDGS